MGPVSPYAAAPHRKHPTTSGSRSTRREGQVGNAQGAHRGVQQVGGCVTRSAGCTGCGSGPWRTRPCPPPGPARTAVGPSAPAASASRWGPSPAAPGARLGLTAAANPNPLGGGEVRRTCHTPDVAPESTILSQFRCLWGGVQQKKKRRPWSFPKHGLPRLIAPVALATSDRLLFTFGLQRFFNHIQEKNKLPK